MQAPIAKFVRTMNEVPGKFVRTLAAVRDAKTGALDYPTAHTHYQLVTSRSNTCPQYKLKFSTRSRR